MGGGWVVGCRVDGVGRERRREEVEGVMSQGVVVVEAWDGEGEGGWEGEARVKRLSSSGSHSVGIGV